MPVAGSALGPIKSISLGYKHTCVKLNNGSDVCWGENEKGQLGNGISGSGQLSNVPVASSALELIKSISLGYEHTCAVLDNGSGMCWGGNINRELGDGNTADSNVPVAVSGLSSVKAISTGSGI